MAAPRRRLVAAACSCSSSRSSSGATTFVGGLLAAPLDVRAVPPAPKPGAAARRRRHAVRADPPAQRREVLPADQIPEVVRQAIISAEDARFLDHRGVDPLATLRAAYRDLTGGRRQGGSTITQQYVKNVYVGNERTFGRKLREASVAVRLEQRKSKDEILTDYLNVLYLGNSTYGVQAASLYYFGVGVQELGLEAPGRPVRPTRWWRSRAPRCSPASRRRRRRGTRCATSRRPGAAEVRAQPDGRGGHITSAEASEAYRREAAVVPERVTPPEPPSTAPEYADIVTASCRSSSPTTPTSSTAAGCACARRSTPTCRRPSPAPPARCCPTPTTRRPRSSRSTSAAATSRR
jgi:hypothetical protein